MAAFGWEYYIPKALSFSQPPSKVNIITCSLSFFLGQEAGSFR